MTNTVAYTRVVRTTTSEFHPSSRIPVVYERIRCLNKYVQEMQFRVRGREGQQVRHFSTEEKQVVSDFFAEHIRKGTLHRPVLRVSPYRAYSQADQR